MKRFMVMLALAVLVPASAGAESYENVTFDVPAGWMAEEDFGSMVIYPPASESPGSETVMEVALLPDDSTRDIHAIWPETLERIRSYDNELSAVEESFGALGGRPAKFVTYVHMVNGKGACKTYEAYVSTHDGAPLTVVKYTSEVADFDRFLPAARALFDSVRPA